jgi:hypothetical protein
VMPCSRVEREKQSCPISCLPLRRTTQTTSKLIVTINSRPSWFGTATDYRLGGRWIVVRLPAETTKSKPKLRPTQPRIKCGGKVAAT